MTIQEFANHVAVSPFEVVSLAYSRMDNPRLEEGDLLQYSGGNCPEKASFLQQSQGRWEAILVYSFKAKRLRKAKADAPKLEDACFSLDVTLRSLLKCDCDVSVTEELQNEILKDFLPSLAKPYFFSLVTEAVVKAGLPTLKMNVFVGSEVKKRKKEAK